MKGFFLIVAVSFGFAGSASTEEVGSEVRTTKQLWAQERLGDAAACPAEELEGLDRVLATGGKLLDYGCHGEAAAVFEAALENHPESLRVHRALAHAYLDSHRFKESYRRFKVIRELAEKQSREKRPDLGFAFAALAEATFHGGEFKGLAGLLDRAVSEGLVDLDGDFRVLRALLMVLEQASMEIILDFLAPLNNADRSLRSRLNYASAMKDLGLADAGWEVLQLLNEEGEDSITFLVTAAGFLNGVGNPGLAKEFGIRAVNDDEDHPLALLNLGESLRLTGDVELAVRCFRQALAAQSDFATASLNLSTALTQLGDLRGALEASEYAVKQYPSGHSGLFMAHANRARICMQLRDYFRAFESYNEAIAINPNVATLYFDRGICLVSLGNLDGSERNFRKALELDPNLTPARNMLIELRRSRGRGW